MLINIPCLKVSPYKVDERTDAVKAKTGASRDVFGEMAVEHFRSLAHDSEHMKSMGSSWVTAESRKNMQFPKMEGLLGGSTNSLVNNAKKSTDLYADLDAELSDMSRESDVMQIQRGAWRSPKEDLKAIGDGTSSDSSLSGSDSNASSLVETVDGRTKNTGIGLEIITTKVVNNCGETVEKKVIKGVDFRHVSNPVLADFSIPTRDEPTTTTGWGARLGGSRPTLATEKKPAPEICPTNPNVAGPLPVNDKNPNHNHTPNVNNTRGAPPGRQMRQFNSARRRRHYSSGAISRSERRSGIMSGLASGMGGGGNANRNTNSTNTNPDHDVVASSHGNISDFVDRIPEDDPNDDPDLDDYNDFPKSAHIPYYVLESNAGAKFQEILCLTATNKYFKMRSYRSSIIRNAFFDYLLYFHVPRDIMQ
jgi:hypothetical protein